MKELDGHVSRITEGDVSFTLSSFLSPPPPVYHVSGICFAIFLSLFLSHMLIYSLCHFLISVCVCVS